MAEKDTRITDTDAAMIAAKKEELAARQASETGARFFFPG